MIYHAILCFVWIICSSFAANHTSPEMSDIDNQTALAGENVTFVCEILTEIGDVDEEFPLMEWHGPFGNNLRECSTKRLCVLDLSNVTEADQGFYTCSVISNKLFGVSVRNARLTVISETDIPPPENVSALHTPSGVLVRWDQPKTALEVTSYRVYYTSTSEDNLYVWKYSDANGTDSQILIQGFRKHENYTVKVQTIYKNYHSRNVSRTGFSAATLQDKKSNTDNSEYKVYLLLGISSVLILSLTCFGFALRKRYQKVHTDKLEVSQSNRSGSDMSERSTERESGLYEEIDDFDHSYESITSNSLVRQRSLTSNKNANEPVQDESYNRERLGSLTARKVLYPDNNGSTNYIHPVYSQMDSYTNSSQYVLGRIPENFRSTDNIHRVDTSMDSEYVYGRIPDDFGSASANTKV